MRIMHIADLHLARPYTGIKKPSRKLQEVINQSTDLLLGNILQVALKNEVEIILVAGDTFHDKQISQELYTKWENFLVKLDQYNIAVYLICGNHDPYGDFHQERYPKNVHLFTSEDVQTKYYTTRSQKKVAITGFSYNHSHIEENKILEYPKKFEHVDYHLGLYHGQQTGSKYAPFELQDIKNLNYDYLALGHYHQLTKLTNRIVYAGTTFPKKRIEESAGKVLVITLEDGGFQIQEIDVAPIRYVTLKVKNSLEAKKKLKELSFKNALMILITFQSKEIFEQEELAKYLTSSLEIVKVEKILEKTTSINLSKKLEEELIKNYQKLDIYEELYRSLPSKAVLDEIKRDLNYNREEIIQKAMILFKEDLEN